jgi:outer membrane biosynthesis protein TonB
MRAVVTICNKVRSRLGTGGTVSTVAHVLILGSTLVWFSAAPLKVSEEDSIPIDIISDTQLSKLTAGIKTAPKAETPKPMADKVGEAKQPQDQAAKVVDNKPEVRTASKEATPPPEPPKPKAAEAKKPEPKTDEIAEALKKAEKKPAPPKPQPQPKKPDPNLEAKIESKLALLDKRESQRQTITNTMVSPASLGTTTPNSQFLMQSWMGALRARVESFWDIPAGSLDVADLTVQVRVRFNRDGSLKGEPVVLNDSPNPAFRVAAEASLRALRRGAPYSFLPASQYETWNDVELDFRPQDMFRSAAASAPKF